jgi:hypothetical protein
MRDNKKEKQKDKLLTSNNYTESLRAQAPQKFGCELEVQGKPSRAYKHICVSIHISALW